MKGIDCVGVGEGGGKRREALGVRVGIWCLGKGREEGVFKLQMHSNLLS